MVQFIGNGSAKGLQMPTEHLAKRGRSFTDFFNELTNNKIL